MRTIIESVTKHYDRNAQAITPVQQNTGEIFAIVRKRLFDTLPPVDKIEEGFNSASNATSLICYEQGHEKWMSPQEQHPEGVWSYEGLRILATGDYLKVFDPEDPTTVKWEGEINLKPLGLFTDDAHGLYEKFGFRMLTRPDTFMEIVSKPS